MNIRTKLLEACKASDIEIIIELLSKRGFFGGAKININGLINGVTPLYAASITNQVKSVKVLLLRGADANKANLDGKTPLWAAVRANHLEVVKLLTESDADMNKTNKNGKTALIAAVKTNCLEMVKLLVESGADFKIGSTLTDTPLCKASEKGYSDIVSYLLKKGAVPDGACLNLSSVEGHHEVVKLLIEAGVDVDSRFQYVVYKVKSVDFISLISASAEGHLEVVKLLVESGADLNITNNYDHTPLDVAEMRNQNHVIEYLNSL